MKNLIIAMLNEGIDEDTICNVIEELKKYQNAKEIKADVIRDSITKDISNARKKASARADYSVLNCSLSESCLNDIINLVEQLIQESSEE